MVVSKLGCIGSVESGEQLKSNFTVSYIVLLIQLILLSGILGASSLFAAGEAVTYTTKASKKVLFIGNSYTSTNNLPELIKSIAQSTGNDITYTAHTPGSTTFQDHAQNATVEALIQSDAWDVVTIQGQSQEPTWLDYQIASSVHPYADTLAMKVQAHSNDAMPLYFMTWGRENGDASNCAAIWWVCEYETMDDKLQERYISFAGNNHAAVAPVAKVWRNLKENFPSMDLFSGDGSHPSITGSYAAAVTFYTMIFKKDPTIITWNSSLSAADADSIKAVAKRVVLDSILDWQFQDTVIEVVQIGKTVEFGTNARPFETVEWDFGDGNSSIKFNPTHTFASTGVVTITLHKYLFGDTLTLSKSITITDENLVALPDGELKDSLKVKIPACFSPADSLIGTCAYQSSIDSIVLTQNNANLTGISYLNNLEYLSTVYIPKDIILPNSLRELHAVADSGLMVYPDSIKSVTYSISHSQDFPNLPEGAEEFSCGHCYYPSVSNLPQSLKKLSLTIINNQLIRLDLPSGLTELTLASNINVDPVLPAGLKKYHLLTYGYHVTNITLPVGLEDFRLDNTHSSNSVPVLPSTIKTLYLSSFDNSAVGVFSAMPVGLERLTIDKWSQITAIPQLPQNIIKLFVANSSTITSIPATPATLDSLIISNASMTDLTNLNEGLIYLKLADNMVSTIDAFPSTVTHIDINNNDSLKTLPVLPAGIKNLIVESNGLTALPDLPDGLEELNASGNDLTMIDWLPNTLTYVDISYNNLTYMDNIPTGALYLDASNNDGFIITNNDLPAGLDTLNLAVTNSSCMPNLPDGVQVVTFLPGNDVICIPNMPSNSNIAAGFPVCESNDYLNGMCIAPHLQGMTCNDPLVVDTGTVTVNGVVGDQWYSYTPAIDTTISIGTCENSTIDSHISLYSSCDSVLVVSEDYCGVGALIRDTLEAGHAYKIKYDTRLSRTEFQSTIKYVDLAGISCEVAKTVDVGTHSADMSVGKQWFKYVVPEDGSVTVGSCNTTDEDTYLSINSSCGVEIAEEDDNCGDTQESYTIQNAVAGQEVLIAWWPEYTSEEFDFEITFVSAVPAHCAAEPTDFTDEVTACDAYEWHGTTYDISTVLTDVNLTVNQCAVVASLDLTLGYSTTDDTNVLVCQGDSYRFPDSTIVENIQLAMNHTSHLSNALSCDSIVVTTVIVNPTYESVITDTLRCGGYQFDGELITEPGDYQMVAPMVNGCDSTVVLHLVDGREEIISQELETISVCEGDGYTFADGTFQDSVTIDTLHINAGALGEKCLISVATQIVVQPTFNTSVIDTLRCGEYVYGVDTYSEPGVFSYMMSTAQGCDSVVTLTVVDEPVSSCPIDTSTSALQDTSGGVAPVFENTFAGGVTITLNNNKIAIELEDSYSELIVSYISVTGDVVRTEQYYNQEYIESDVPVLTGVYIVKVEADNRVRGQLLFTTE